MQNNTQNVNEMVEQFINQLVVEAGMNKDLEEGVFDQLKKDLKERLENRINAIMLSQIPENKLAEFEKLLDGGDENATQAFCSDNIPNLAELIAAEFLSFRKRYIA